MLEIEKIIQSYSKTDWSKEKAALGIVVNVDGSSYRRIGARLFVRSNGTWEGGISGGCLEGDALRQAQKAILSSKPSIVVYDTTEDDQHQIGIGLGCNGRIEVLFIPIDGNAPDNQVEFLKSILYKRSPSILYQILESSREKNTDRGLFFKSAEELANHTGLLKSELSEITNKVLNQRKSNVLKLSNKKGQSYSILTELISPKIRLICLGDNYDVLAMMKLVTVMGWSLEVIGKKIKIPKAVFTMASKVHQLNELNKVTIDDYTAVLLMSHDFRTDMDALYHFLENPPKYLGLLGPKTRMEKMQIELTENGSSLKLDKLKYVFGPTGLDIGSRTPEEISLSIIAEIISVFRERNGGHLKFRIGTINDRLEIN